MITSTFKARIRFDDTEIAADDPVDTSLSMLIHNNARHAADSAGQVRVAWAASKVTTTAGEIKAGHTATGTWKRAYVQGPFPLTLDHQGIPYSLRARIAGHSENVAATADFRLVVSSRNLMEADMNANGNNVLEVTGITATGAAWIGDDLLTLTVQQTEEMLVADRTIEPTTTNPVGVQQVLAYCSLWTKTSNITYDPVVDGAYIAEFAGV